MLRSWNEIKQNVPRKGKRLRQNPGPGKPYSIHLLQASWGGWDEWWWWGCVMMCQEFEVVREGYFVFWPKKQNMGLFEKMMISTFETGRFERKTKFWDSRKLGTFSRWISDSVPLVVAEFGQLTPLPFYNTTPDVKQKEKRWKMGDICTFWIFGFCTFWIVFGSLYLFEHGIFVPFPFSASKCTFLECLDASMGYDPGKVEQSQSWNSESWHCWRMM